MQTEKPEQNVLRAHIREIDFTGATTTIKLYADGLALEALVLHPDGLSVGDVCSVALPPNRITILGMREE